MNPDLQDAGPARRAAFSALQAVTLKGRRVEEALSRTLARAGLDPRDRALAGEIVYGTLRWQARLDHVLSRFTRRPLDKISPPVLIILRLGAYQILFLDRVPDHAAVSTAVALAKKGSPAWVVGFVNAVLRRVAQEGREVPLPDRADLAGYLSLAQSHPRWAVERFLDRFGPEETEALLAASNRPPVLTLRANVLKTGRDELLDRLTAAGLDAWPGTFSPQAVLVPGADRAGLDTLAGGRFTVQSEAAQLAALALVPEKNWRILDACAGAGGKTTHLAELTADQGEIVALDPDSDRLAVLAETAGRLGLKSIQALQADARRMPDSLGNFQAALVDAPCTNSGVWRSRPDGRWRIGPDDPGRLSTLQTEILSAVAERVRPGGILVYATCSLFQEENQLVVGKFLSSRPDWRLDDPRAVLPPPARSLVDASGFLLTLPHRHDLDGFFVARLRRV